MSQEGPVSSPSESLLIPDHAAMVAFGREVAATLNAGDVLLLHGDLGAGKTTLVQGIAAGLGIVEPVQSPTFGLVAEYQALDGRGQDVRLYHLDLYRLESEAELEGLGYERFIASDVGISVIEWPERAGNWLPDRFQLLRITHDDSGGRLVERSWH